MSVLCHVGDFSVSELKCWNDTLTPLVCCTEGRREGHGCVTVTSIQIQPEQTKRHAERLMGILRCDICVSNENLMTCLGVTERILLRVGL